MIPELFQLEDALVVGSLTRDASSRVSGPFVLLEGIVGELRDTHKPDPHGRIRVDEVLVFLPHLR